MKLRFAVLYALPLVAASGVSQATIYNLSDGNTSSSYDDSSYDSGGLNDWIVDGIDHLYEQEFMLRIDNDTKETVLTTADYTLVGSTSTANSLTLNWQLARGLTMGVTYTLVGGSSGSNTSTITETISISSEFGNTVSLFAYTDFDVNDDNGNDSITMIGSDTLCNSSDGFTACVASSLIPTAYEVDDYDVLLTKLTDSSADTLSNTGLPYGPDDGTFAFQYDFSLGDAQSVEFQLVKTLTGPASVPVPAPLSLLGLGFLGLGLGHKKRSS